ncbi:MAG TPA: hypothetical protein VFB92_14410 [Vicinamibacterales bacterium]|nr:hypothetical protein [Vicinamibacterales bacterium]
MKPSAPGVQPLATIDRIVTVMVAAVTFVLRWLTLDFDNDYFMHMAWAADMLRGQWPVRDFVEPGFPLQTFLAYAGLRYGGYQLSWEGFIAGAFISISVALAYILCRRMGVPRWLSVVAAVIAFATFPRLYTYPKAFVYPAAMWALLCYQSHPSPRSLFLVVLGTAVAFLFRHDHAAWIVPSTLLGLAFCHWRNPRFLARTIGSYGIASLVMVSPWLIWVALSGHAGQYLSFLVERGEGLTDRARLPLQIFEFDNTAPIVTFAPVEYPVIGIRWAAAVPDEQRRALEARYRLLALPDDPDRYRLTNLDSDNVRALLSDPAVEDTSGIDRRSMRTPDGAFPWLYLQLQRYMPLIRLRVLPGFVKPVNAEPWLTDVTFFIPWFVLVVELIGRARPLVAQRHDSDSRATALIVPTAALSIITYQTLVRASPDSRLGDIVALTAFLLAWSVWRLWTLGGMAKLVARPLTVVVLLLTLASAVTYGRVITRVGGVGVDGPINFARRLSGVGALYATRPLDLYAPPGATGLAGVSRWLNECTDENARVALIGFEPQVFFISERSFAGGLAFYDLGWNSSDEDQALVIERWSRQQVPVVLAMESEWGSFSRDYPAIRRWIDVHYEMVQQSAFEGAKPLTVLTGRTLASVREHQSTGLPCFR